MQVTVRKTTDEEHAVKRPYLTSSMVEAVNTCPRWGLVHNVHGRQFSIGHRQMALEAGSLMHEVFSCLNLLQVGVFQRLPNHMHNKGRELFGVSRWKHMFAAMSPNDEPLSENMTRRFEKFIYACIATSEFHDDPNDKNRTVTNLEICSLELLQYWMMNFARFNIYIEDRDRSDCVIGIEQSLDVVFEVIDDDNDVTMSQRFIGLADAVYQGEEGNVVLGEYKTTSSMNEGWREAFKTRHQITAYQAMLQAYFDKVELKTIILGSAIPVRSTAMPVQHFPIERDQGNILEFLETVKFTGQIIKDNYLDPLHAPMFTHSCNRYFRPCSMMDLCTAEKSDQYIMYDQMYTEEKNLSPSEMKALLRRD